MRIVFMGTPDFAVPALTEIVGAGYEVVAAYTRAPRPAGRGLSETQSPVGRLAEAYGIPVFTPNSLKGAEEQETFASLDADLAVVVAYGLILPKPVLDAPREGCLNLHASLLPRWRGAAPIQRAVMAGDAETGIMVMRMEEGLDTGPICLAERVSIGADETAGELHDRLARLGGDLMLRALGAAARGALHATPQGEDGVVYARKIEKAEARIDWTLPARAVHDHIRGLSPFPGAWFEADLGTGQPARVKALRSAIAEGQGAPGSVLDEAMTIACGEGAVRLAILQRAGKGAMPAQDFLRGAKLAAGMRLA